MIQLVVQGLENTPQIGKIHHPTSMLINLTADMHLDLKGMAMQPCTFVTGRHIRQVVGRLNLKYSEYIHASIVGPEAAGRNPSGPKRHLSQSTSA